MDFWIWLVSILQLPLPLVREISEYTDRLFHYHKKTVWQTIVSITVGANDFTEQIKYEKIIVYIFIYITLWCNELDIYDC